MAPMDESWRPVYTPEQVSQYLQHVQIAERFRLPEKYPLGLQFLTQLHVHHISTFPYENLLLHYDSHYVVSLDPRDLFKKMITNNRGRGGYCFESVLFFMHMLQSLGFDVYPTGVRIRLREEGVPQGPFTAMSHVILIITLQTTQGPVRYISDPAFGGDGPTAPLPLTPNQPTLNFGTQEVQYIHEPIPQLAGRPRLSTSTPQPYWQYQYRNSVDKPWRSFYAFQDNEYLPEDFIVSNQYTSSWSTFQRRNLLTIRFSRTTNDDGLSVVSGKLMLVGDTLKRNLGGKTEVLRVCKTEEERVQVLKEMFDLTLTDGQVRGIKGLPTEMVGEKVAAVDYKGVLLEEIADEDVQNTG